MIFTGIVALLGVGLLRISVPPSEDPGYVLPLPALIVILVLVAALSVAALRVLPRRPTHRRSRTGAAVRPAVVGITCGVATLGFLGLLFPFAGARQPAFTHGNCVLAPMLGAAALATVAGLAVRRWSSTRGWTARHRLAAIAGALVAHTAFGVVANADGLIDRLALIVLGVATVVLLGMLASRLHHGAVILRSQP
jgi:hypothetical protein